MRFDEWIVKSLPRLVVGSLFVATVQSFILPSQANPSGASVRHGEIFIERSGDTLRITQATASGIIDWNAFSVAQGEVTQFIQPGATSATLNRVTGGGVSQIDGSLLANGRVFLLNPNGVLIGKTGRVDTGGFTASTLDLSNENFLSGGDLHFKGNSKSAVINLGKINASDSDVFLIASSVINEGEISARNGTVGLAAGNDVLIAESGSERVFVKGKGSSNGDSGVINKGTINANIAELKAYNGNVYGMAVQNKGRVAVNQVTKEGGQIFLRAGGRGKVRSTGTLRAKSHQGSAKIVVDSGKKGKTEIAGVVDASATKGKGGKVVILGERVDVMKGSLVIADGETHGGRILIGGGKRGLDLDFNNAAEVTIEEGAMIRADAGQVGNGGEVILFAEEVLDFQGKVSVEGGSVRGDGGFVEVSGKDRLRLSSDLDQFRFGAANGSGGTVLIDPHDLTIVSGTDNIPFNTIGDQIINNMLVSGNVILETASGTGGSGDILIEGDVMIDWNTASDLTLDAYRNINVGMGALIRSGGSGEIHLMGNGHDAVNEFSGVSIQTGARIESVDGDISISGIGGGAGDSFGILIRGEVVSTGSGDISLYGQGGAGDRVDGVRFFGGEVLTNQGDLAIEGISGDQGFGTSSALGVRLAGVVMSESGDVVVRGIGSGTDEGVLLTSATTRLGGASATGDITIEASSIRLRTVTVQSSGKLNLRASGSPAGIRIGDGVADEFFHLDQSEIDVLQDGFESITIGFADSAGNSTSSTMEIGEVSFSDSVEFLVGEGGASISGDLLGTDNASITFLSDPAGAAGGADTSTALAGRILTDGNRVDIQNQLMLVGGGVIDTTNQGAVATGADVVLGADVTSDGGGHDFDVDAGTMGHLDIAGDVGQDGGIGNVDFVARDIDSDTNISAQQDVSLRTHGDTLQVDGDIDAGGEIRLVGSENQGTTIAVTGALDTSKLQVDGGAGSNVLDFSGFSGGAVAIGADQLDRLDTLRGSSSSLDRFQGAQNSAAEFRVLGSDSIEYQEGSVKTFTVENFEGVVGGNQNDTFQVNGTGQASFGGTLDGGGGSDRLVGTASGDQFTITAEHAGEVNGTRFQSMEVLDGGGGSDRLVGSGQEDQFSITADNAGEVNGTSFQSIESLDGGGGNDRLVGTASGDTFSITAEHAGEVKGTRFQSIELLDGGGGSDRLVGTASSDQFTLTAEHAGEVNGTRFQSMEVLDGGGGSDRLTGTASGDTFSITGDNAGEVKGTSFQSIESLDGGGGNDRFEFSNQSSVDQLVGGLGVDTLVVNDTNLTSGQNYTIGAGITAGNNLYEFSGIEAIELLLGSGNDSVVTSENGLTQRLVGGAGTDSLDLGSTPVLGSNPYLVGSSLVSESEFETITLVRNESSNPNNISISPPGSFGGGGGSSDSDSSSDDDVAAVSGLRANALSAFGAAGAGAGETVVKNEDGQLVLLAPSSLDGFFTAPPLAILGLLGENLEVDAWTELASSIGYDGPFVIMLGDGPGSIEFGGAIPPEAAQWLMDAMPWQAERELYTALQLPHLALATPYDGLICIFPETEKAAQIIVTSLLQNLNDTAKTELSSALGD